MESVVFWVELLVFFGAGGVILGAIAGLTLRRPGPPMRMGALGCGLGVLAGLLLSWHPPREVLADASPPAAIGLILVPSPPIFNAVTGYFAALFARRQALRRSVSRASSGLGQQ